MPLTASDQVQAVSFTISDNNGQKATFSVSAPGDASPADVDALALLIEAPLAALTNGNIVSATATRRYTQVPALGAAPPPESEVERKLSLTFRTAAGTTATYEVPSCNLDLSVAGTNIVPITNPLIVALATAMINGPFGANNGVTTGAGIDLVELVGAREIHRGRRAR